MLCAVRGEQPWLESVEGGRSISHALWKETGSLDQGTVLGILSRELEEAVPLHWLVLWDF